VQVALARYNLDGAPDSTFSGDGQVTTDFDGFNDDAFSILVQLDGKLVTVCSAKNPANFYDFAAARYLSNGTIDTTFGVAGKAYRLRRSQFRSGALGRSSTARQTRRCWIRNLPKQFSSEFRRSAIQL
jgi:uncharacterized delta-60 repeat protein